MVKKKDLTTEQKILEVAEELFLNKGFAVTSTTEIARKVGCNHAMLHYYFRTKEKLFQKIFEAKITAFAGAFFEPGNPDDSFELRLRRKIGAHFDIIRKNPRLPLLILTEMASNPERIALLREAMGQIPEQLLGKFGEELEKEIREGNIRPITAIDLFMNILSMNAFLFVSLPAMTVILGLKKDQVNEYIDRRREEIIETIVRSLRVDII